VTLVLGVASSTIKRDEWTSWIEAHMRPLAAHSR
jgi:hypothetical protein